MYVTFFLFLPIGCSDMFGEYNNNFSLEFLTEDSECLKDLRVNIYLLTGYSPSRWYEYYKHITVVDNGKVLVPKIQEEAVVYYSIESLMPACNLYYNFSGDNTYSSENINVNYEYMFSGEEIYFKWHIGRDKGVTSIKYEHNNHIESLPLYSTNSDLYFFDGLSDSAIDDIARLYTFEELLREDKLLESDINRLPHLTKEQKNLLMEAHAKKKFKKIN